jgi:TPR repeat protein
MRLVDPDPHRTDPLDAGLLYFRAEEPDHEQAVYWFRVSSDAGNPEGLAMLAYCQLEGLGLPRDPVQARAGLERASAAGSLTAKFHLGRMLVGGWGGPADATRGIALYTAAASQGHADATFHLAACLEAGWGCLPDRVGAKALFLRAHSLGCRLKAPGLRIRERELPTVRELARRFELDRELDSAIEERQHELALMQELVQLPQRRARKRRRARAARHAATGSAAGLTQLTRLATVIGGVAGALAGLIGWRGRDDVPHDAGPTSIA